MSKKKRPPRVGMIGAHANGVTITLDEVLKFIPRALPNCRCELIERTLGDRLKPAPRARIHDCPHCRCGRVPTL